MCRVCLIVGLLLFAAGCGYKGPLYLPDDAAGRAPPITDNDQI